MTAGEWFWGGFYLGFGVLASSLIVVGGFSIIMAIIEHVSDERADKKFKEDQEKRRQEEFENIQRLQTHGKKTAKTDTLKRVSRNGRTFQV